MLANSIDPMFCLPARIETAVEQIHPGVVLLSVPLVDDVIQVGTARTLMTATIEVTRTPSTMVVRRTDGRHLQAEILHDSDHGPAARTPAFREPVDALRLRRVADADNDRRWIICAGWTIRRHRDVVQLVETITAFSLAKQRRVQTAPQAAASA